MDRLQDSDTVAAARIIRNFWKGRPGTHGADVDFELHGIYRIPLTYDPVEGTENEAIA
ncbi:MAG: hypothetical protein Q9201_000588 [Fulgogasparrea decipioides]